MGAVEWAGPAGVPADFYFWRRGTIAYMHFYSKVVALKRSIGMAARAIIHQAEGEFEE